MEKPGRAKPRFFTANNGKVTIYGRLMKTTLDATDAATVEVVAAGILKNRS
jgi:hypothetical protein